MRNSRYPDPLDLSIRVATSIPFPNRLGMPCIACGSPVDLGQVYCPGCRNQIAVQTCRKSMHVEELERLLAVA
jgi:hypothetical protein